MNETGIDHRLVRNYLRALDSASASLPGAKARELREQIIAHLDDALPSDATDDQVKAELKKLGNPKALAADAAGPRPTARRLLTRLSRVRWWAWTVIGMALAVIIAVAVYLNLVFTAEPLSSQGGTSAWYFAQDRAREVDTQAANLTQSTVPERFGQPQGFVVSIFNDSDWTQTIVGPDPVMEQTDTWQPTLAVGSGGDADRGGSWDSQTRWTMPASIPPHSVRLLRVLWISRLCGAPGTQTIFQDVVLRVRVGLATRSETIQLDQAWGLLSTKAYSCA